MLIRNYQTTIFLSLNRLLLFSPFFFLKQIRKFIFVGFLFLFPSYLLQISFYIIFPFLM